MNSMIRYMLFVGNCRLCAAVSVVGLSLCCARAQTTINFDNAGDLATYFNTVGSFTNYVATSASGGVSNLGSLAINQSIAGQSQGMSNLTTGLNQNVGGSIMISILQKTAASFANSNSSPYLWLNAANNTALIASSNFTAVGINVNFFSGSVDVSYDAWNNGSRVGAASGTMSVTNTTISPNEWYLVTFKYTPLTGGDYKLDSTVDDYGSDGTTYVTTIASATRTVSGYGSFGSIGTLYPAFSADGFGNATNLDNFSYSVSAIPEPSTYAAIFGAVALGGALAWRRTRKVPDFPRR